MIRGVYPWILFIKSLNKHGWHQPTSLRAAASGDRVAYFLFIFYFMYMGACVCVCVCVVHVVPTEARRGHRIL